MKHLPELKKRHMRHFDSKTSFDVLTFHSNACEKYYRLLAKDVIKFILLTLHLINTRSPPFCLKEMMMMIVYDGEAQIIGQTS